MSRGIMFTQHQIDELIRLGWAPEYDEQLCIVGFDKVVYGGGPVILPSGLELLAGEGAFRVYPSHTEVVSRKWYVFPPKGKSLDSRRGSKGKSTRGAVS